VRDRELLAQETVLVNAASSFGAELAGEAADDRAVVPLRNVLRPVDVLLLLVSKLLDAGAQLVVAVKEVDGDAGGAGQGPELDRLAQPRGHTSPAPPGEGAPLPHIPPDRDRRPQAKRPCQPHCVR